MPRDPIDDLRDVTSGFRARQAFTRDLDAKLRFELTFVDAVDGLDPSSEMVEVVRAIAMSMPAVEEYLKPGRGPSWRAEAEGFLGFRNDGSLIVWVASEDRKDALIASAPDRFFSTPHYDGYPIVLVRLDTISHEDLRSLIVESWRLRAPRSRVAHWDATEA